MQEDSGCNLGFDWLCDPVKVAFRPPSSTYFTGAVLGFSPNNLVPATALSPPSSQSWSHCGGQSVHGPLKEGVVTLFCSYLLPYLTH